MSARDILQGMPPEFTYKEFTQELNKKEYKDLAIDNRRLCNERVLLRQRLCTFPYDKEVDNIVNEFLRNNLQYDLKDLCIEVEHNPENELLWCNGYSLKISIQVPEEGSVYKERIISSKKLLYNKVITDVNEINHKFSEAYNGYDFNHNFFATEIVRYNGPLNDGTIHGNLEDFLMNVVSDVDLYPMTNEKVSEIQNKVQSNDNKIILKLPYFDTYYEVYPHEYLVKAPYLLADSNDSLHYEISSYIPLSPHVIDKSACKWYLELAVYTRPNDEII